MRLWNCNYRHSAVPLLALLAACGTVHEGGEARVVNLTGFSASFRQGYSEGCNSAGTRNQRRDESRYRTEADYMRGWNDGFSACRRGR
jgi:hypothetical protein